MEWINGNLSLVKMLPCLFRGLLERSCGQLFFYPKEKQALIPLNPFPNKPGFYVCALQAFWKQLEKEKLLVTSNFSFSRSVFYPFWELGNWRQQTLSVWKRLKCVVWERVKFKDCEKFQLISPGAGYKYEAIIFGNTLCPFKPVMAQSCISVHTGWVKGRCLL